MCKKKKIKINNVVLQFWVTFKYGKTNIRKLKTLGHYLVLQ